MLGAPICEYWGVGVLIHGNWVSLYSSYGHALIFGTNLIYEKLENYPFSAYKGMSLYAGQYGNIIPSTTDEAVLYIIYLCISYQIR